ncbi:gliding motility-associated C-terminal domain-containing protein [Cytophagaceae bacterium DM2B3-1]|uniref:Gliding motility-associated C-terminal domain-containing protein n=1 Tax=Xanthocytophaga flava TaxID=3048013 RepID=A0ABT7CH84_9BACT|nr:gliding motility-associated C-terminal domain-containing protein [Xanthocytophaga flavus]MDJ1492876.1 gliding motility-associated C-terminal domain-containing protein [Xanthocytophaga flavus]
MSVSTSYAQSVQINFTNPGFEDFPRADSPPQGWKICGDRSTPDTQPGQYGVLTPPAEGKTYLSMVCRTDGSYEAVQQTVSLKAGQTYCFRLQLAFNDADGNTNYKHAPAKLRIWSASTFCKREQLLWTSPTVTHTDWQWYQVNFTCQQNQPFILFEAYFAQTPYYWGRILIDNISSISKATLLPKDTIICQGDSLILDSEQMNSGAHWTKIQWQDTTGKSISEEEKFIVTKPGRYLLQVWDECVSYKDTIRVRVKECEQLFEIPNVITPNQDGKNDVFAFPTLNKQAWHLQICNRWGETVYQTSNYQQDWSAEGLPAGIYYYRLEKRGFKPRLGWLEVLR